MLDIKLIRQNPDKVKECLSKRGCDVSKVDKFLELDEKRKKLLQEIESLRSKQNKLGKDDIVEAKQIKEKIKSLDSDFSEVDRQFNESLVGLPNIPYEDIPEGKDGSCNVTLRTVGKKRDFKFKPKDYLEVAEKLDLVDIDRAAKVSGTRFGYFKKQGAMLELAIVNFAFDFLLKKGFTPVIPPVMLKKEVAKGMGYFEQVDEDEAYFIPSDDLFLVGTSEQSIGVMHSNEVLKEEELPKRYVAFSTCFRREAGSYGKDTKGVYRVHQFDKVEMFSFCHPKDSKKENEFLLSLQEKLMQELKLHYRVIRICAGDLGFPSATTYDIETWMPGQNQYRETHSTSNCTDFQARRLNIRFKDKSGKLNFVHTVNGTAFAMPRTFIAIIENYQQEDGTVEVPKALQKYSHFKKIK